MKALSMLFLRLLRNAGILTASGVVFMLLVSQVLGAITRPELFASGIAPVRGIPSQATASTLQSDPLWDGMVAGVGIGYTYGQTLPLVGPVVGMALGALMGAEMDARL